MDLRTILCLFVTCVLTQCNAGQGSYVPALSGERQKCKNEGERVFMENQIKNMHCYSCICKNGLVECRAQQTCSAVDGCHLLLGARPGECCQRCKGCLHGGISRDSHTEWQDPHVPCLVYRCEAGVVTRTSVQCYTPCDRPLPPKPGKCCGTCPGCRINGQNVTRDVTIPEDPCVKCHCEFDGRMTCLKRACPVLQCTPYRTKLNQPGECCPVCTGTRSLILPPRRCLIGNKTLSEGESWRQDSCTVCQCLNETAVCRRQTCPVLDCDPDYQTLNNDRCCPSCEGGREELTSICSVRGKTYQDGEEWRMDACKSCRCEKGSIRCAMQRCPKPVICPPGSRNVKKQGECCETCQEDDAVCTVFGDPHYKTFDGKFFSFQGSCKYQLTTDCLGNNTFTVRVTNDPRNTRFSSWTRTVAIKSGNLKINLGQKLRVKVNGKRITMPYELQNGGKIERHNDTVIVDVNIGIKILWNGRGFLEVSASPKYKQKLCGLCGNYNNIAQDDLTMRNKRLVGDTEVWRFANSWKVGGKKACGRQNEQYKKPQCKIKNLKHLCRPLKFSETFGDCDAKLSPSNYYEACVQDMCECPNFMCYCESFAAYAKECTRLGANLPDWRRNTKCHGGKHHNRRFQEKQNRRTPYLNPGFLLNEKLMRHRTPRPRIPSLPIH